MKLDSDQQKIVELDGGLYAVLAGAGSGKSTVLLYRTARLADEHPGKKIACVTFTAEAAKNLRDRIRVINPRVGVSVFCTLHALALRFAYEHADAYPFHLADSRLADEGVSARAVFDAIGDSINFKAFTNYVSIQKRKRVDPATAVSRAEKTGEQLDYAIGYRRYQELLKKQGVLDFDDLIYQMVNILETRPDIRQKWQFDYVMQDEAQDACELDWRMLQLLTQKHKNLLCVGDSGQALFGFRGGVSKHLLEMDKMFPGTKTLYLGNNYRSLPEIVSFGKMAYPFPDIANHFKAVRNGSATICVTPYSTDFREAEEVVKKVQIISQNEKLEDCSILARTNLSLRPIEEALLDAGVNYHILGDSGFWEAPEVKNVLFYLRCATTLTNNSILGALRTPFWPTKYLKKKVMAERIEAYTAKGMTAWEALGYIHELSGFRSFIASLFRYRYMSTEEAVKGILKDLKALDHYKGEENINPDRNPIQNLKELAHASARHGSLADFLDFIRRLSYARNSRKGVCLSTIHSAKGKEWRNVFLISVNAGILPHSKSENLEEEKCCFFVGCSRAMDRLEVSYYGQPSPFLGPWIKDGVFIQEPARV